jgi:hypothetical protein
MKRFGLMAETSGVEAGEPHSPTLERVGKYVFWFLVIAVLLARAIYAPAPHPVVSGELHQPKTEIVR